MNNGRHTAEGAENAEFSNGINAVTELIIGSAMDVHSVMGPGLLESAYEICLCHELSRRDVRFECQKPIPLQYKGVTLDCGYRADLIVEQKVLVEVKSIEQLAPIHDAQLLSYLKITGLTVGLLINFNVRSLREGIRRKVLRYQETLAATRRPQRPLR